MDIIFSKFFMTTYTETQGLPVEKGMFHDQTQLQSNLVILNLMRLRKFFEIFKDLILQGKIHRVYYLNLFLL